MSDKNNSTSSTPDKYYPYVSGLNVKNAGGVVNKRYILTTRKDGAIFIDIDNEGRCFISTTK